jgi:hypothetical protein
MVHMDYMVLALYSSVITKEYKACAKQERNVYSY